MQQKYTFFDKLIWKLELMQWLTSTEVVSSSKW